MVLRVVSVSGGKDSTATALLALDEMAKSGGECRFVFCDTGNEHELTLDYMENYFPKAIGHPVETLRADFTARIEGKRKYIQEKWPLKGVAPEACERALAILHPTGNPFLDLCLWKGRFPSRKVQFCTQELKRIPLDTYLLDRISDGYEAESWRGIRRDESRNRKDAEVREQAAEGYWVVQPIAYWTAQQVVDFVRSRGIELNPLYTHGMGRVGCMPCINVGKDELNEIAQRFPNHIDRIREWEQYVSAAAKRGWTTFFTDGIPDGQEMSDADILDWLRIDSRVEWAKTAHGGRQLDFTRTTERPSCSSQYGLCE